MHNSENVRIQHPYIYQNIQCVRLLYGEILRADYLYQKISKNKEIHNLGGKKINVHHDDSPLVEVQIISLCASYSVY